MDLLVEKFREIFGCDPEIAVYAPGRVNLIGEHVDYNDGYVLPFALPYRTTVIGKRSNSVYTRVYSSTIKDPTDQFVIFKINKDLSKGKPSWSNYVKGTVFQYIDDLPPNAAFDAIVMSDVPMGSGLSSSAALEYVHLCIICNIVLTSSVIYFHLCLLEFLLPHFLKYSLELKLFRK
jgi:galactokinase